MKVIVITEKELEFCKIDGKTWKVGQKIFTQNYKPVIMLPLPGPRWR